MASGKRYKNSKAKIDAVKRYTLEDAMGLVLETANAKFDEGVDVAVRLGVDATQSDQQVRGGVALPHGLGKTIRIAVFAKGEKENEAKNAGADVVGGDDLVQKINGGWMEFDKVIATPDMMATVSKVAKILGPRGLMPNPKVGTVTFEVGKAVTTEKKGKLDFRVDKAGNIHASIGRKSMGKDQLKDNFSVFLTAVVKAKPATSKGIYLQGVTLSSTMGPGVKLDVARIQTDTAV